MALKQKFFSGPTLTQALLAAARHHQVNPDDLAYREMDRKRGSLRPSRAIVIEVDPDSPTLMVAAEEPEVSVAPPVDPPTPAVDELSDEASESEVELQESDAAVTPVSPDNEGAPRDEATEDAPENDFEAGEPVSAAPTEESDGSESPSWLPPAPVEEGDEPAWPLGSPEASETASSDEEEPVLEAAVSDEPEQPEAVEASVDESMPESSRGEPVTIDDDLRSAVSEAVDQLAHLAGLRVQVASIENYEDGLAVELEGPDGERMTARGGRALLAIQHLLPRLLFSTLGRAVHCRVDSDGFHASRVERLERLAMKAAERVRTGGRSWLLDPMPPDERRLVHMALADEPDVETESVGKGFLKRVRVAQA